MTRVLPRDTCATRVLGRRCTSGTSRPFDRLAFGQIAVPITLGKQKWYETTHAFQAAELTHSEPEHWFSGVVAVPCFRPATCLGESCNWSTE